VLDQEQQYKKYQWVEVDTARNKGDQRPESHRVLSTSEIKLLHEVSTDREWEERRKLVLGSQKIYTNLKEIIGLAKPDRVLPPTTVCARADQREKGIDRTHRPGCRDQQLVRTPGC